MKLILQIACYNEAAFPQTAHGLPHTLPGVDEIECLVVDNSSTGRTARDGRGTESLPYRPAEAAPGAGLSFPDWAMGGPTGLGSSTKISIKDPTQYMDRLNSTNEERLLTSAKQLFLFVDHRDTGASVRMERTGMEETHCNLCGATESFPMYTFRDTDREILGEFLLHRCLRCGLMYLSPRPTQETMEAYYPEEYEPYRPAIGDERWALMRWMRRRKLVTKRRLIERYGGKTRGRLLDVGCSTGLFLQEMARAGWQVAGVEPIASAADYARCRFGLDVFQGMLAEAPYDPISFDVVTFWDVLEHTFSPIDDLNHAARLLRPGGLLIANVPNWDSPDRWLFGRYWLGVDPPRHLYVFTRRTLAEMLARAGFSVLSWVCFTSGYFSFAASLERWLETVSPRLAKLVRRLLGLPGMRFPFEPWFTLINWLGKGPNISVIARKATGEGEA